VGRKKARSRAAGIATSNGERCADCGVEPEVYLVDDDLWAGAELQIDDGLCLACLTRRVGRTLRRDDFVMLLEPSDLVDLT
jgi:hypothetical protein